jgi:murein DD-endopeptidase MepM/ murein hydrolase activator NlpD
MSVSPLSTHAGVFSVLSEKVKQVFSKAEVEELRSEMDTSQTMALIKPVVVDEDDTTSAVVLELSSSSESLKVISGALRVSSEDIDFPVNDTISVYEVKKGDTLADIAKLFGVSKNTIMWANNMSSQKVLPGDVLLILPVTGIKHTVKNGDTVTSVAKKYKADVDEVARYNGIASDALLAVGDVVLVPEGEIEIAEPQAKPKPKTPKTIVKTKILDRFTNSTPSGFLARPVIGGIRTQGIHGHNGIDIAATPGTPVLASAGGRVIAARVGGYNGGYGNMVIVLHDNNIQTVYAHLKSVQVSVGDAVNQGEQIGTVGNTGRSTGPHLHFEVRGAVNPF